MAGLNDFISIDTVLAILSIAIGIIIFLMQARADSKINGIIERQFTRQELEKKYFGRRMISNLELVKKSSLRLEQYLGDYLRDRSQVSKNKAKNFCVFQTTHLDGYVVPSLRDDLARLISLVDDIELVDLLSSSFDDLSSLFKDCSVDSAFEEPDTSIREKIVSSQRESLLIDSLVSKLTAEISTTE
jgi:hypothetical protein